MNMFDDIFCHFGTVQDHDGQREITAATSNIRQRTGLGSVTKSSNNCTLGQHITGRAGNS